MNGAVEKALEKSWNRLQQQKQQQQDELALYFNLYTREYAPDGKNSETYNFFDSKEQPVRYFRKVPQQLSLEEVEALKNMRADLEATTPKKPEEKKVEEVAEKTTITGILYYIVGCLGILFTLYAFALQNGSSYDAILNIFRFAMIVTGILSTLSFFAIGKALLLLQDIANNTRK